MFSQSDYRDSGPFAHWAVKMLVGTILFCVVALILVGLIRSMFFTWVDNYHFGYTYYYWSGEKEAVAHNGYVWSPFYSRAVHTIDLRPMQVCISSIQRVLNCKLVHFDPFVKDPETGLPGWELFIKWHGRGDYQGPGTVGSSGVGTSTLFREILMNYAYDGVGRSYPFLVIEKELKGDSVPNPGGTPPKAQGGQ